MLAHSSEGSVEYGDGSGYMGGYLSMYRNDMGGSCFNPAKNWQLGWYGEKFLDLSPGTTSINIKLRGVVDFENALSDEYVGIRIEGSDFNAYYIGFNHNDGFNDGVGEALNMVTVQEKVGIGFGNSWLTAKLAETNSKVYTNFDGNGNTLTISVTSIDTDESLATVQISSTPAPTQAPTPISPTWVTILGNNFEKGWGTFKDGGKNAMISTRVGIGKSTQSLMLRAKGRYAKSVSAGMNIGAYSKVSIRFVFKTGNVQPREKFRLSYNFGDGTGWKNFKTYEMGPNKLLSANGKWFKTTDYLNTQVKKSLQLRFQSGFADTTRRVYIDNVVVKGRVP